MGRHSKVLEWLEGDNLILLEGWAREGLTDAQIAHNMGINIATLYRWKNDSCTFCEVLKRTKEVVDFEVENALYKSAMSGNTTAQIFWLKNRKPKYWRDKPEVVYNEEIEDDGLIKALKDSKNALISDEVNDD